jgi:hypothetical protein
MDSSLLLLVLVFGFPIGLILIGYKMYKENKNSNWGLFLMIFGVIILIGLGTCAAILMNISGAH